MKILFIFLVILASCNKDRCYNDTVIVTDLKLSNQEYLSHISQRLFTDDNPHIIGNTVFKTTDSIYKLEWDVTKFVEGLPKGKVLYVKTRLYDWRDGSYYYLGVDTLVKE